MSFSASKQAGFALAALLRGDRDLGRVRVAIETGDAAAIARLLETGPEDRRARVGELLDAVRPRLNALPAGLPPRVGGLLAPQLPRDAGRAALEEAPALRSDFVAGGGLTPCLLRIARRCAAGARAC